MTDEVKASERGVGWPPESWPTLCFLGLGASSIEYLASLARLFPELQLVLMDVLEGRWLETLVRTVSDAHDRIQVGNTHEFAEARGNKRRTCQGIAWSLDTPSFSFYRYRELFYSSPYILALFNMQGCTLDTRTSDTDRYYCEYLHSSFQSTLCGKVTENKSAEYYGEVLYFPMVDSECGDNICMCYAHSDAFLDFHFEHLCRLGEEHRFMGQWGQDRFLLHNVFQTDSRRGRGLYIDVGASHPFHLSNTAYFDSCLEWQGVCIEPNPRSRPILEGIRSCAVVTACAWANATTIKFANGMELAAMTDDESLSPSDPFQTPFHSSVSDTYFEAPCAPLHDILIASIPLALGKASWNDLSERPTIDLLSVDAEGAEIEIFRDFPFEAWNIHSVVVETSRRTSMAIDGLLLPHGFHKIALLGKDAVYVHRKRSWVLPDDGPLLPNRIVWNEPGTESDTIEYLRFQRLFGVDGDLDVDVGDQRLQNETELSRQAERLEASNAQKLSKVIQDAQYAAVGGFFDESQREAMEQPWAQDAFKDPKVKSTLPLLMNDAEAFLREVRRDAHLKAKITRLIEAGVIRHPEIASALGVSPAPVVVTPRAGAV